MSTELTATQSATSRTASVAAAHTLDGGFLIQIDDELELVEKRGTQIAQPWQVQRGMFGTEKAAHDSGADVTIVYPQVQTDPPADPPVTRGDLGSEGDGQPWTVDESDRLRGDVFAFIGASAAGSYFSLPNGASFDLDNDDTGERVLKATFGAGVGDDTLEVTADTTFHGPVTFEGDTEFPAASRTFQLADAESFRVESSSDATTFFGVQRSAATLIITTEEAGVAGVRLRSDGLIEQVDGSGNYVTVRLQVPTPEVPATPTAQDIVDALVTLGYVTQAS